MDLDTNLVKQFVESTNDSNTVTTRKYFYGTFKLTSTSAYVQLDGSDAMTPVSLGSEAKNNDRVVVTIENHKASILSNLTTPASGYSASDLYNEVTDPATGDLTVTGTLKAAKEYVDSLVAENILVENIVATDAYISTLTTDNVTAESLTATDAYIKNLRAANVTVENITATTGYISTLTTDNVTAESLTATDAYIKALKTDTIVAGEITANAVTAEELKAMKIRVDQLDVTSLDATYAQIDWANITEANVTNLLVKGSFLANDVMSATGIFTKYLTGVNIVGDNITAGTIVTDRLVLKDETPDYYCSSPSDSNYFYSVIYDAETKTYVKQTSIYSFINPHGDSVMDKNGNQATTTTGNLVFNIYKSILYKLNNNILDQTELSYDELKRLTLNGQVITAESITATQIAAEAITAEKIVANAITADKCDMESIQTNIARIGQIANKHIDIDANSIDFMNGESVLATFSEMITLGTRMPNGAIGVNSVCIGKNNIASGQKAIAMGDTCRAAGVNSFATGEESNASGGGSACFNGECLATGIESFACGECTTAAGEQSFAGGEQTVANGKAQFVIGRYNVPDNEDVNAFIIGNGTAYDDKSNALVISKAGDAHISKNAYVGGDLIVDGDILDNYFILDRNPSWPNADNGWIWTKFRDGTCKMEYMGTVSASISQKTNYVYESLQKQMEYPFGLTRVSSFNINYGQGTYPAWIGRTVATTTKVYFYLMASLTRDAQDHLISIKIEGSIDI